MLTVTDLLAMKRSELAGVMRAGSMIEPESLDDFEFKGLSLGLPRVIEAVTWKQFKKVFFRDPATGWLRGWNMRIEQGALDQPWQPKMRGGTPVTFGRFRVVECEGARVPRGAGGGLLIDYGAENSSWYNSFRWLRDPIVAVNAGDSRLLLGWSYLDFGFGQLGTPSFFSLQRDQPLSHRLEFSN